MAETVVSEKKASDVPAIEGSQEEIVADIQDGVVLNAAGYRDQLKRQYGLLSLAGLALTVDNAWVALGSSISVSIRKSRLTRRDDGAVASRVCCLGPPGAGCDALLPQHCSCQRFIAAFGLGS